MSIDKERKLDWFEKEATANWAGSLKDPKAVEERITMLWRLLYEQPEPYIYPIAKKLLDNYERIPNRKAFNKCLAEVETEVDLTPKKPLDPQTREGEIIRFLIDMQCKLTALRRPIKGQPDQFQIAKVKAARVFVLEKIADQGNEFAADRAMEFGLQLDDSKLMRKAFVVVEKEYEKWRKDGAGIPRPGSTHATTPAPDQDY